MGEEIVIDIPIKPRQPIQPLENVFYWLSSGYAEADSLLDELKRSGFRASLVKHPSVESFAHVDITHVYDWSVEHELIKCTVCGQNLGFDPSACDFKVDVQGPREELICGREAIGWFVGKKAIAKELADRGFKGVRTLAPKNENGYCLWWATSTLRELGNEPFYESDLACHRCNFQPLICSECHRVFRKCPRCSCVFNFPVLKPDQRPQNTSSTALDARLKGWDGSDIVICDDNLLMTGRVVEYLLDRRYTAFCYGPVTLETAGCDRALIEKAKKLQRKLL
ncbi:MAG: hypothetical protein ACTHK7_24475 [Aureliella sp.]